jgi:type VI protein secretion system component VasK
LVDDRLVNDIRRQYLEEYRLVWDRFLTDVHLRQPKDLRSSIDTARLLVRARLAAHQDDSRGRRGDDADDTGKGTINRDRSRVDAAKEASSQALNRVFGSAAPRLTANSDDPNRPGASRSSSSTITSSPGAGSRARPSSRAPASS